MAGARMRVTVEAMPDAAEWGVVIGCSAETGLLVRTDRSAEKSNAVWTKRIALIQCDPFMLEEPSAKNISRVKRV